MATEGDHLGVCVCVCVCLFAFIYYLSVCLFNLFTSWSVQQHHRPSMPTNVGSNTYGKRSREPPNYLHL
uniref:Uncharacterized protein n=1 Tax=Naja naja TaxID=35670 RepID=A0A8C7E279_NAJNA